MNRCRSSGATRKVDNLGKERAGSARGRNEIGRVADDDGEKRWMAEYKDKIKEEEERTDQKKTENGKTQAQVISEERPADRLRRVMSQREKRRWRQRRCTRSGGARVDIGNDHYHKSVFVHTVVVFYLCSMS